MNKNKIIYDLCGGSGAWSHFYKLAGYDVRLVTLPQNDVRDFVPERAYGVLAAPPCTEFSRESMPWCRTGQAPDMTLVMACLRVIAETRPRFWVIENTRGAVPWFAPVIGPPRQIVGPFFLWGNFPHLGVSMAGFRKKESYPSTRPDLRAMVPEALSLAIAVAVESQGVLQLEAH